MTLPPRRNVPLLVLSFGVLGWLAAFLLDARFFPAAPLPVPALASTALGTFAFPLLWLAREECRAARENRARLLAKFPPVEVIPVARVRPPGFDPRRMRHRRVITIHKRHVRRVPKLSHHHSRRNALGLASPLRPRSNRLRYQAWYRRIIW